MALQGVILDVDGTLVLSNDIHAQTWVDAFANFGYDVSFDQIRPLMGMGGDHIIPKFAPGLNDQDGEGKAIADYRKSLLLNGLSAKIVPTNGARDLVLKLQAEGLKLTIASSASPEELSLLLKTAHVDDLLHPDQATTSSDAESSKPAADIVEAALKKSKFDSDAVIMLGDTPYDVESAGKAGVRLIAFRSGGFSDADLKGAIAIYDDPADLVKNYNNSPLAIELSNNRGQ
jgi:phosphoglycolate phosphatase-like HAD superfamily hydrolase